MRLNPSQSEILILIKIQSDLIRLNPRLPFRINPEVLNPNESEVKMI